MWPDSAFARPVSSYERPVALVLVDPCDQPDLTVSFRSEWLPYILGSLKQLVLQTTWKTTDPDQLWLVQQRAMDLLNCFMQATAPVPATLGGLIEDFEMPIRVDCDCNVFVTCCDGSEVQLALKDMLDQPNQPNNAPLPPAGGGQQAYNQCLNPGKASILPPVVNTGDTLSIESINGAWNDTTNEGFIWRTGDGLYYFLGAGQVGTEVYFGTDPVPTAPHMSLIAYIDGTFYPLYPGGGLTVPGGVVNQPVSIMANTDAAAADMNGQVCFVINVVNNQGAAWSHDYDFRVSPYGFVAGSPLFIAGKWVVGQGWVADSNPNSFAASRVLTGAGTMTRMVLTGKDGGTIDSGSGATVELPAPTHNFFQTPVGGALWTVDTGPIALPMDQLTISLADFGNTDLAIWTLHVEGFGPDPFI